MGRSKKVDETAATDAAVAEDNFVKRLSDEVEKEYGKGVIVDGFSVTSQKPMVIPICPTLDIITSGGIEEGSWVGITGNPKTTKAQPLHATVYTPTGARAMGDIQVGDKVLNSYGGVSTVIGVFPQGNKDIYRVTFQDGDAVECCKDHIWAVKARQRKSGEVKSTEEIAKDLYEDWTHRPKWSVRLPEAVAFNAREVPIEPYTLGLLLGDACFSSKSIRYTTADQELLNALRTGLGDEYVVKKIGASKYDYGISMTPGKERQATSPLHDSVKDLGLWGKLSGWKFIPRLYIFNSKEVRLAILQGLMDTDGCASNKATVLFRLHLSCWLPE